ncbi:CoA transferase [Paralcaligenes sp. KSB-10]|uniref:CoA transferase n=1 Tax=Paralcaligenes sp. KSB-10 TaxID=2901142 RepID=UPI001E2A2CF0|nr:CoA transferase [Paralcaligenes sp. KSB-10]UHL63940.1 CoA transferase [Paralcaligenes sp. KSB-10]
MSKSAALYKEACRSISELLESHSSFEDPSKRLRLFGSVPPFDSRHKLSVAAAGAIGAYALAVEKWWHMTSGQHQVVGIDWMQAASSLNPGHFQKQSGYALPALSLLTELKADFYKTADERWFFPIGSYPHLRDGVLDLLQSSNSSDALGAAIRKWNAQDLEDAFAREKLPGVFARSREEWLRHPQGRQLSRTPVIEIEKIGDSDVEHSRAQSRPLENVRVLDMGHVIAGPVVARSLAEHGAEVLRVSPPLRQDPFRQTIDTNIGKRSAFIDLNSELDRRKIRQLIVGADVMVQSWRSQSLKNRGLGPEEAAAIRPGIIYVSVSAFGDQGPWATRGGFEQLGQVVSGIALEESRSGRPRLVPTYLLNDYLTGYLGAAGVMLALIRRATEGGSYHVKVSLTRTSMWVQSLGLENEIDEAARGRHFAEHLNPVLEKRQSAYGVLEQLPPVAHFSHTQAYWSLPPAPIGAHEPAWLSC